jgi:hypothetical protein
MAKAPAIPKYWQNFIANYVSHDAYWYFPKARAVNNLENVRDILKVLAQFEGEAWKNAKPKFLEKLESAKLFERHAEEQSEADSLAMARILKVTFDNLGFAWIDDEEKVSLTLAGKKFIETEAPHEIFERQLWRYQIANPLWGGSEEVRLFPHAFLLDVMLESELVLSRDEFVLFVARARTKDEVNTVIDYIDRWRMLDAEVQKAIIAKLYDMPLDGGDEDKSMINRVVLNSSYCLAFHSLATYLNRNVRVRGHEYALSLSRSAVRGVRSRIERFWNETVFIDYESKKDWIAAYGDLENNSTKSEAVEYYSDRSNVDKAVEAFMLLAPEAREGFSEEEYKQIQVQEKVLEDYLESNITILDTTLKLVKDGRQYETVVGPIDLLAIEESGGYVVVELKKGRAADKVFGQLCRYMGYIKREVANGAPVRGIIVGKEIDQKLQYAVEAVPKGLVSLKAFDFKLAMQDRGLSKKAASKMQ